MERLQLRRFQWWLQTRGADFDLWPRSDQDRARALMGRSAQARVLFADALADEPPPNDGATRVIAGLHRRLARATPLQAGLRWGALAVCAALGLLAGQWLAADPVPDALTLVQAALVP